MMDIPVFHDDQHGTAIIAAAGLINALHLTGRNIKDIKAGGERRGRRLDRLRRAAQGHGPAARPEHAILCDTKGVIYKGRTEGMNQWKSAHAVETKARTLDEAMAGADVFFGLSAKGAVTPGHGQEHGAFKPIIFAMANPDPEITPEDVKAVRADAIVATGPQRLCQPGQQRPRLPLHLPRRARRARAHHQRPDEDRGGGSAGRAGAAGCARRSRRRLCRTAPPLRAGIHHPGAVRSAPHLLRARRRWPRRRWTAASRAGRSSTWKTTRPRSPRASTRGGSMHLIFERLHLNPRRVVFAEGEEERVIRAAIAYRAAGYGTPVLIGRTERIHETIKQSGLGEAAGLEIVNAANSQHTRALSRNAVCAAAAPRRLAARRATHGQSRPQRVRRLHGAGGPCRRDGDRRHPQLRRLAWKTC